jgi:hypothetical protein
MKLVRFLKNVFNFESEMNCERVDGPAVSPFMWGLAIVIAVILICAFTFLQ